MADKWAVILGVTGGSGAAVAKAVSNDPGLNIFGVHRGNFARQAQEIQDQVSARGNLCHMRIAGAGTAADAELGARELEEVAGRKGVSLFVHAIADASYGMFASSADRFLHPKQFEKTFNSMAHSFVYWVQQLVARDLLADGATMIALTNPMVDSVVHGWGLVAAAKAALEIYVKQLADELGPAGYRVMLVKFGLVETQAIKIAFSDREWSRVTDEIAAVTPIRRLCAVEEVGRLVSYMTRPEALWFNGATVDFSGGQTASLLDCIFNKKGREGGAQP